MKKSAAIFLIISMLLALSGCAGVSPGQDVGTNGSAAPSLGSNEEVTVHKYTLTGESESWTAELNIDHTDILFEKDGSLCYDSDEDSELIVTYKGDISDLESVKNLRIVCGEDSIEDTFNNGHSSTVKTFKMPVSFRRDK